MTLYNRSKRPFQAIWKGKNLDPGKWIEIPDGAGERLLKAYPRELADTAPKSQKKKAAELKKKEAELAKREADLEAREKSLSDKPKKSTAKKSAPKKDEGTPWEDEK